MEFPVQWLSEALGPLLIDTQGDAYAVATGITTDSRQVKPGDVYVALVGEKFDGHDFVAMAVEKGATAVVVSRPVETSATMLLVSDTLLAYGLIARAHRLAFTLPLAMVVGSNGKTTTTQMLARVLAAHCGDRALSTQGNFNNEVGVPRTLLGLHDGIEMGVVEAGINHRGEMARLAAFIRPTLTLVTNAQREHQEFLDGVRESARENGLAIVGLMDEGVAVLPATDPEFGVWHDLAVARGVRFVTYGLSHDKAEMQPDVWGELTPEGLLVHYAEGLVAIGLQIAGEHNAHNALGVFAAAREMGVPLAAIIAGLEAFQPIKGRGTREKSASGNLNIIDESYNANPDSVRAAMRVLAQEPVSPKIFVLGDMGEVGENAQAVHHEVGAYAKSLGIDQLIAIGPLSAEAACAFGEGAVSVTREQAYELLKDAHGVVTIKASHFMGLERLVAQLTQKE